MAIIFASMELFRAVSNAQLGYAYYAEPTINNNVPHTPIPMDRAPAPYGSNPFINNDAVRLDYRNICGACGRTAEDHKNTDLFNSPESIFLTLCTISADSIARCVPYELANQNVPDLIPHATRDGLPLYDLSGPGVTNPDDPWAIEPDITFSPDANYRDLFPHERTFTREQFEVTYRTLEAQQPAKLQRVSQAYLTQTVMAAVWNNANYFGLVDWPYRFDRDNNAHSGNGSALQPTGTRTVYVEGFDGFSETEVYDPHRTDLLNRKLMNVFTAKAGDFRVGSVSVSEPEPGLFKAECVSCRKPPFYCDLRKVTLANWTKAQQDFTLKVLIEGNNHVHYSFRSRKIAGIYPTWYYIHQPKCDCNHTDNFPCNTNGNYRSYTPWALTAEETVAFLLDHKHYCRDANCKCDEWINYARNNSSLLDRLRIAMAA